MDVKEKMAKLEDLFEMDNGELTESTALENIEAWDSLSKLSLIVLLDEEFGKPLSGAQIKKFVTVQDILDFMEK